MVQAEINADPYRFRQLLDQYMYVLTLPENYNWALHKYTGDEYESVNAGQMPEVSQYIDRAFQAAPPLKKPLSVYRRIEGSFLDKPGQFISTGLSPYILAPFKEGISHMRILLPVGSQILPLALISTYPDEQEVLLPRTGRLIQTAISEVSMPRRPEGPLVRFTLQDFVFLPENPAKIPPRTVSSLDDRAFLSAVVSLQENRMLTEIRNTEDLLQRYFAAYQVSEAAVAEAAAFLGL